MTMTTTDQITEAEARVRQLLADAENKDKATRTMWTQVVIALSAAVVAAGALLTAGVAIGRFWNHLP
jgi:hypothetical protein